jgi:anti-anti-sigma factor
VDDDRHARGGIEVADDEVTALVRLWGEVDATLRDQASAAMVELLRRGGPYVVDVAELTFIDSSGVAFILQLHRLAMDEGSTAVLRDPSGLVTDVLKLIGLSGAIPCEVGPAHDGATDVSPTLA